jgi:hypothetical protein
MGEIAPADRLVTLPPGIPELTLGWIAIEWAATYLRHPNGPRAGLNWEYTESQVRLGVPAQNLMSPGDEICGTLPGWLARDPQLQVLGPVVIPDAVDVVDILALHQETPERFLHHYPVLSHPASGLRRMIGTFHDRISVAVELVGQIQPPQGYLRRAMPVNAMPVQGAPPGTVGHGLAARCFAPRAVRSVAIPVDVMLSAHTPGHCDHGVTIRDFAFSIAHKFILPVFRWLWW